MRGALDRRSARLGLLGLALALCAGCLRDPPVQQERSDVRILIPSSYKEQIRDLLDSGVRDFSFGFSDIRWVDMPGYRGLDAVFAPSLAARFADSSPDADVYFIDLYRIGSFRPDWLTPFDAGAFADVDRNFRADFLRAVRLETGSPYAIPWSAKGNFLFYRKDLVPEPPRTWKELRETCQRLRERRSGVGRLRYCLLLSWEQPENDLYPVMWSLAEHGSGAPSAGLRLTSDGTVGFFYELADMVGQGISSNFVMLPPADQVAEVGVKIHRRFANGEAVFMINWNNRFRYMIQEQEEAGRPLPEIGIAPIPRAADADVAYSNIGAWGWIVPRAPDNATEIAKTRHARAMTFVEEVSSPEAVRYLVEKHGLLPARRDVELPRELVGVLAPEIVEALERQTDDPKASLGFRFRDRGSDSFVHGFVRDAVRDVLTCSSASTSPLPTGLVGDCARYVEECFKSNAPDVDCFAAAIRQRLEAAERHVQAAGEGTR